MRRYKNMDHKAGKESAKNGVKLLVADKTNINNRSYYEFKNMTELNTYIKQCGGRSQFKGFFLGIYTQDDRYFYKNNEWFGM